MLTSGAGDRNPAGFSAFDFSPRESVVAAVSGGGDSLALLLLLQTHLRRAALSTRIVAVTVDHGLRAESAAEAVQVGILCRARGLEHRVLRWDGAKPATGISAAAREARYLLLAQVAAGLGADLVLTGHTADDQAETVAMRARRGDGLGLAGMAPATLFDATVWIGRPLLDQSRAALRAFLQAEGVAWIDDPSNANPASERVRVRREIAASADPEASRQMLLAQAAAAAVVRAALGERAADIIRLHARQVSPGLFRLSPDFAAGDPDAAHHALRLLLAAVGGATHLPDESRASLLFGRLAGGPFRATLAGAAVDARKPGIFLHREFRGEGPAAIPAAAGVVWDGRFRIDAAPAAAGLLVAPFGKARAAEAAAAPASLVRAALAAQPYGHHSLTPLVSPYARFLPSFDLAAAQALAELLRAPPFPPPPFAGDIAP